MYVHITWYSMNMYIFVFMYQLKTKFVKKTTWQVKLQTHIVPICAYMCTLTVGHPYLLGKWHKWKTKCVNGSGCMWLEITCLGILTKTHLRPISKKPTVEKLSYKIYTRITTAVRFIRIKTGNNLHLIYA